MQSSVEQNQREGISDIALENLTAIEDERSKRKSDAVFVPLFFLRIDIH